MRFKIKYILIYLVFFIASCKHHQKNSKSDKLNSLKKEFAFKLGVSESEIKNEKLFQFIDDWEGVPYKYGGKDKTGIDCSALTAQLYLDVYSKTIASSTKDLIKEGLTIKESDLKEGDLLFFNTEGKKISHVGVYLKNNKFLHASTKKGVMISDLNEPYFKKTYVSSGRIN